MMSATVRSPISWTPSASLRLTSMITGIGEPSSASMNTLIAGPSTPR
jgi:hypothetical protein